MTHHIQILNLCNINAMEHYTKNWRPLGSDHLVNSDGMTALLLSLLLFEHLHHLSKYLNVDELKVMHFPTSFAMYLSMIK